MVPLDVIFPVFIVDGEKVATDKVPAVIVPLALILPDEVILPVMFIKSLTALPKVVLPLLVVH